jgi:hypothetical protein
MRTNQLIEHLHAAEQERQQQARSRADDRREEFAADEHAGIDEACQNHYLLPGGGYTIHRCPGLTTRVIVGDRAFTAAAGRLSPVGQPASVIGTPGELADHLQHPLHRALRPRRLQPGGRDRCRCDRREHLNPLADHRTPQPARRPHRVQGPHRL